MTSRDPSQPSAASRRGSLFVISAPSGSGKTTLVQKLLESTDEMQFCVSYTTRDRRGREKDGVDYHFVSAEAFRKKIEAEEFLEWAEVYGNYYGTGRQEADAIRDRGIDVILDIDVQGAAQVRKVQPDAASIFVMPPSFQVLEKRLRDRQQDSPEAIASRLEVARREVARYSEFHYVLVNEDVEQTSAELRAIVRAERARPRLLEEKLRPILASFELGS